MSRFKRKPEYVEAVQLAAISAGVVQFHGHTLDQGSFPDWLLAAVNKTANCVGAIWVADGYARVNRAGGLTSSAEEGDWIVRLGGGDIYVCPQAAFSEIYEAAE